MNKFFNNEELTSATVKYIDNLTAARRYEVNGAEWHIFGYRTGKNYIKITYNVNRPHKEANDGDSVWAFVDKQGNIYKAASWQAPAKGIRGNVKTVNRFDGYSLYK